VLQNQWPCGVSAVGLGALVEAEMRPHVQHEAGEARGQFGVVEQHRALARLGQQHAVAVLLAAQQHAGLVALEQQQHGQGGGVDVGQRGALQLGRHAGARGRALGEVERQAAVDQRQAGRQRRARGVLAVQAADLEQAVEQRIGMHQVLPHGAAGHRRRRRRDGARAWRAVARAGRRRRGRSCRWVSRCGRPLPGVSSCDIGAMHRN
jgi:hypothetical protein